MQPNQTGHEASGQGRSDVSLRAALPDQSWQQAAEVPRKLQRRLTQPDMVQGRGDAIPLRSLIKPARKEAVDQKVTKDLHRDCIGRTANSEDATLQKADTQPSQL